MKEKMPQEIEVWDLLPAIRKALAQFLVHDFKLSQKKTAEALHITEPAVSQYLQEKRGKTVVFSDAILQEIKASARAIKEKTSLVYKELQRICDLNEVKKIICTLHKDSNTTIPCDCDICLTK